jgi:hypothetical protein
MKKLFNALSLVLMLSMILTQDNSDPLQDVQADV